VAVYFIIMFLVKLLRKYYRIKSCYLTTRYQQVTSLVDHINVHSYKCIKPLLFNCSQIIIIYIMSGMFRNISQIAF
jgi:hypothetical protein